MKSTNKHKLILTYPHPGQLQIQCTCSLWTGRKYNQTQEKDANIEYYQHVVKAERQSRKR